MFHGILMKDCTQAVLLELDDERTMFRDFMQRIEVTINVGLY
jgi:hypothetical protein